MQPIKPTYNYLKKQMLCYLTVGVFFAATAILTPLVLMALLIPFPWYYPSFGLFSVSMFFLKKYYNYKKGMAGEIQVAEVLGGLGESFYVFHDLLIKGAGGNIDHVVVGPTGIFAIETKNYNGKLQCIGDEWRRLGDGFAKSWDIKSPSIQAKRNAAILANTLRERGISLWVYPLVVFSHPDVELDIKNSKVDILRTNEIRSYIKSLPKIISDDRVRVIAKVLMDLMEQT